MRFSRNQVIGAISCWPLSGSCRDSSYHRFGTQTVSLPNQPCERTPTNFPIPLTPTGTNSTQINNLRYIIAIVGPTASGKSALGIEVALRTGGEIINCDSVQVLSGDSDCGPAKVPVEERRGVPHHLIDFVSPGETSLRLIGHAPQFQRLRKLNRWPCSRAGRRHRFLSSRAAPAILSQSGHR